MIKWHIGCSGFHYKHWKGSFYPEELPQTKWFSYYCQFFNTVELNVTFYRFPRVPALQSWYKKSPEDFRFSVKAPRAITHFKKFNGTAEMIFDFYTIAKEGLQEKLGCVLFQLPPNVHYSSDRLQRIIDSLDNSFLNVLEFRHESWWNDDVYKKLSQRNISFSGMSHPTLPKDLIGNTPLLYYRLHGEGEIYASNYTEQQLSTLVDNVKENKIIEHAYVFFNNDIHTFAVHNARQMLSML